MGFKEVSSMPNYWVDHVHLFGPEPKKTAEFYETMFGAKVRGTVKGADGRSTHVSLELNGFSIKIMLPGSLSQAPEACQTGLGHFAIRTDNLEEAVAELKSKGVKFLHNIVSVGPKAKRATLLGPENVPIELVEMGG
jgi:4-hydroxyphenylpyruvate dioxygenase-like putative hemolysin